MANQEFTYGVANTLISNAFTRTGYTFAGWTTNANGTGTSYTLGEAIVPTQNQVKETVLYAQWDKVETKVFNYTKTIQTYTVPANGRYKLEVWGAQGGSTKSSSSVSSIANVYLFFCAPYCSWKSK